MSDLRAALNRAERFYWAADAAGDLCGRALICAWQHDLTRRYNAALNAPRFALIGNGLFVRVRRS